ncbi:MAG: gliding motility-associated C-terminal domain-containing protein, partial [Bacteroidota bacterium]
PNNDGINDRFFVTGLGERVWELQVYDRWGGLRYHKMNYANDWDAEGLPEGVYYYILKNREACGTFFGEVSVLR